MNTTTLSVLMSLAVGLVPSFGQIPEVITYQGYLTDAAGQPVADGSYAMTFRIFDVESGGTTLWTETRSGVAVSSGLFRVFLGESTPFSIAFDTAYWLEVQMGESTPQSPRTRLASAPYSLMSADAARVDGFSASAGPVANQLLALDATGKFPASVIPAVSPGGAAGGDLTGTYPNPTIAADAVTGAKILDGEIANADLANNAVSSGKILDGAVHTQDITDGAVTQAKLDPSVTLPPGGAAGGDLTGTYPNPTITANAVTSAKILDGAVQTADIQNSAVTADKIQPHLVSSIDGVSNDGGDIDLIAGVNVTITPNDGANTITIAAGGGGGDITAVWPDGSGTLTGGAGTGDAFLGVANPLQITGNSDTGVIWAHSSATGLDGMLANWGRGVQGGVFDGTGPWGYLGGSWGAYGAAANGGNYGYLGGSTIGAYGGNVSGACSGYLGGVEYSVYGEASNGNVGYLATTDEFGGSRGAYGENENGNYGSLGTPGYGVYYSGGLGGSGSKSCVVKTSRGPTTLYCQESPESWFEDFGQGAMVGGRARVELDPLFLETVTIDDSSPMKVFVELGGDCNGVYVAKGTSGFDVIELRGGSASVPFDYRVVARRKGFEEMRLDYCSEAESDPFLYPELRDRQRQEREARNAQIQKDRSRVKDELAIGSRGGASTR